MFQACELIEAHGLRAVSLLRVTDGMKPENKGNRAALNRSQSENKAGGQTCDIKPDSNSTEARNGQ